MIKDIGIIVGRFQVPQLHDGHICLLNKALEHNDKVIVFLGISRAELDERNPLDYQTRQKMLQKAYPEVVVLPLYDQQSNKVWSQQIDSHVYSMFPNLEKATLYGGRDSCLPSYEGQFSKAEVDNDLDVEESGTSMRKACSSEVGNNYAFRAGAIYTMNRLRPMVVMATDIALVNANQILLGRKRGEDLWRFPGGKVDVTDQSLEHTARRELQEEANVFAEHMEYVGSTLVSDWRYRNNSTCQIMTTLYKATMMTYQEPVAGDDLCEVKWFLISDSNVDLLVDGHKKLYEMFLKFHRKE